MVTIPSSAPQSSPQGTLEDRIDASVSWFLDRVLRHSKTWLVAVGGVGHDADIERILADADEHAADRVLEFVGLTDVHEHREQLRAMVRAYAAMVKAAGREWVMGNHLSRDQVHLLLSQTLLTLVRDTFPKVRAR